MVESALSLSSQFTDTQVKYLETKFKYNITGLKTPTGRRQPVGYLQVWPRIWTRDNRVQIQQVATAGLEPGTAGLRVRRAEHSATLPPNKMLESMLTSLGEVTGFQTEYWYNFQRPGPCFSVVAMTCRFPKAVYVCRVYIFGLKNYTIKLSVNKQN